ncbi:rhomboid-like protein [Actinomadura oligospora]|uniref:rhomboid-like protein n=1 Tax=Actinomadura oligospora TaxID=111804 RepID=UPI0004B58B7F|nr:rhomboid-like protein [Actinomadura oligospora]
MVIALVLVVTGWYALRALGLVWEPVRRVVAFCEPWTRRAHAWALSAPATFTYVAIFTASTLVQFSAPPKLIDLLTTLQSTNLANLHRAPLRALLDSALWVADNGEGLALYVALFVTVVAWGERRYGTPRILLVWLCGHVLGSLLTALVETHALENGRAPARLAVTTDVGVSYIMVAGCAAAVLLMRGRWLALGVAGLAVGVVGPVLWSHSLWDLGHLFAATCGLAAAWALLQIAPPRVPPDLLPCLPRPAPLTGLPPGTPAPGTLGGGPFPSPSRTGGPGEGTPRGGGGAEDGA